MNRMVGSDETQQRAREEGEGSQMVLRYSGLSSENGWRINQTRAPQRLSAILQLVLISNITRRSSTFTFG